MSKKVSESDPREVVESWELGKQEGVGLCNSPHSLSPRLCAPAMAREEMAVDAHGYWTLLWPWEQGQRSS